MVLTATPSPAMPHLPLVRGTWSEIEIVPGVMAVVLRDAGGKHRVTFAWLLDYTGNDIDTDDEAETAAQLRAWQEIVQRFAPAKGVKPCLPKPQLVQTREGDVLLCAGSLAAIGCEDANSGAFGFCAGYLSMGHRFLEVAAQLMQLDAEEYEPRRTHRNRHAATADMTD